MHEQMVFSAIGEIIREIKLLQSLGKTGSLYLMTRTGDGAVVVMNGGVVVDVIYKSVQGTGALPLFRRITEARYFFKQGETDEVRAAAAKGMTLSYGQTLFRMFEHELAESPAPTPQTQAAALGAAARAQKKKVLVVEDSRVSRIVLCRFLEEHGYAVLEAANGRAALAQLALDKPDLVILDLILPDINGYEIFNSMKENEKTRNIPVIILTSRDSLMDKLKGRMSGSDEYVTKPFKNEVLLQKLEKYLK